MGGFRVGAMWDTEWTRGDQAGHFHAATSRTRIFGEDGTRRGSMADLMSKSAAEAGITGLRRVGHYAHLLPRWAHSLIAIITGAFMATIAWSMTQCDVLLVFKKFQVAQSLIGQHWGWAILFLWATSAGTAALSAVLVLYLHPPAAGSGLPELKGYANGNRIDNLYGHCGNWVRGVGAVLASGAGLAIGREGPIVSLGGSVGVALTRIFTLPFYKVWADQDAAEADQESLELDLRSYARSKRLGCMMGGAAGLTAVFNAPVGATLYMFEEVTVGAWTTQTTFHVLGAAIVSKLVMRLWLYVNGEEVHSIIVYNNHLGPRGNADFEWGFIDLPFFGLVGLFCGLLGAAYSRGSIAVWRLRNKSSWCRRRQKSKRIKVLEVVLIAIATITAFFVVPLIVPCSHALLEDLEDRIFVRHLCNCDEELEQIALREFIPDLDNSTLMATHFCGLVEGENVPVDSNEGKAPALANNATTVSGEVHETEDNGEDKSFHYIDFNIMATFLLQGTEGAIKQLYSRDYHVGEEFTALLLTLIVYFVFALAVAGLPMPTGTFIPNMFMGAVGGRMFPRLVGLILKNAEKWMADPGVYAVVGSAAMLAGFTHMTIAIGALLVEVTLDLYLSGPIFVGVVFGRFISRTIQHYDYNEALILLKGVPYLEVECPVKVHESGVTAGECLEKIPSAAMLPVKAPRVTIQRALSVRPKVTYFPLLDSHGAFCIGLIPRSRLEVIMRGDELTHMQVPAEEAGVELEMEEDDKSYLHPMFEEDLELEIGQGEAYEGDPVDLYSIAQPATHSIPEDTLIAHAWPLFARLALDKVCVMSLYPAEDRDVLTGAQSAPNVGSDSRSPRGPARAAPSAATLMGILDRRHLAALAEEYYHH